MRTCIAAVLIVILAAVAMRAPKPASAGQKAERSEEHNALVGRWDQSNADGFVRFFADGSFRWQLPGNALVEGRYRLLPGSAIEFSVFPARRVRRTAEIKCNLTSDTLRLRVANRWITYRWAE